MRKICSKWVLLVVGMGVSLTACFEMKSYAQDITVEELVNRVKQNYDKIDDFKATLTESTYSEKKGQEEPRKHTFYFKKPNKVRIDMFELEGHPEIIIGQETTFRRDTGEIRTIRIPWGVSFWKAARQRLNYELDVYLSKFDIQRIEKVTDEVYSIQIEVKDIEVSLKEDLLKFADKIFVDYGKGAIIRKEGYNLGIGIDLQGKLIVYDDTMFELTNVTEFKDFVQVSNGAWFPMTIVRKEIEGGIPKVTHTTTFSNLEVNIGIPDSKFSLE